MHEIDDYLCFLGDDLLFFVNTLHFPPGTIVEKEQGKAADEQAEQKEKPGKSVEMPDMSGSTGLGNGGNRAAHRCFLSIPRASAPANSKRIVKSFIVSGRRG